MNNNIFTFTFCFTSTSHSFLPRRLSRLARRNHRERTRPVLHEREWNTQIARTLLCLVPVCAVRRFPGASRFDGERAMSARTRLDSTRETWRSRDEEKYLESVRTRVVLSDLGLEHDVVK